MMDSFSGCVDYYGCGCYAGCGCAVCVCVAQLWLIIFQECKIQMIVF